MKRSTAAILLSALLLTACGTDKDETEPKQTVSASEETVLSEETTLTEETTASTFRTKEEEEEYSRMMGTADCVVTPEVVSVEGEPTLGFIYETTALETESVKLNEKAELCLSKLSFGMDQTETESLINAEVDEETRNPYYSSYKNISVDIDDRLIDAMLGFGDNGLEEIILFSEYMSEDDVKAMREQLIKKLNGIYGFSDEDWENDEYVYFCQDDFISVHIRFSQKEDNFSLTLMISSSVKKNVIP